MCHFYGNSLSILNDASRSTQALVDMLQPEHFEAVRMLPSFRKLAEDMLKAQNPTGARGLLEDDKTLLEAIESFLASRNEDITRLLRVMHVLASSSPEPIGNIQLYMAAFEGTITDSDFVRRFLDSTKRMAPEEVISFLKQIRDSIETGCPEMELDGWTENAFDFLGELSDIQIQVTSLIEESTKTGKPVRSSYAIHSKGVRTTVIAQRVQLSYEKSTVSKQDEAFTALIDRLSKVLKEFFKCENPQDLFLHEVWLYDSIYPYKDVFTPRPRYAIERALSAPHDYLTCDCCQFGEGISPTQPATASIYQMYLEAGSLINISDLWRAFLDNQNPNDEEDFDERETLVLFYRALADLKLLGMIKESKKKVDHLAKVAWMGL
jgi:origin recognition complex subunit 3